MAALIDNSFTSNFTPFYTINSGYNAAVGGFLCVSPSANYFSTAEASFAIGSLTADRDYKLTADLYRQMGTDGLGTTYTDCAIIVFNNTGSGYVELGRIEVDPNNGKHGVMQDLVFHVPATGSNGIVVQIYGSQADAAHTNPVKVGSILLDIVPLVVVTPTDALYYNDFTTDAAPWAVPTGSTINRVSLSGNMAMRVFYNIAFRACSWFSNSFSPGDVITLEFKSASASPLVLNVYDGSNYAAAKLANDTIAANATMTVYTYTFTVPASGYVDTQFVSQVDSQTVDFDYIKFSRASSGTPSSNGPLTPLAIGTPYATAKDFLGGDIKFVGDVVVSPTNALAYGACYKFNGGHVHRQAPALRGDFIFDFAARINAVNASTPQVLLQDPFGMLRVQVNTAGFFEIEDTNAVASTIAATPNTWYRCRLSRVGPIVGLLVNGALGCVKQHTTQFTAGEWAIGNGGTTFARPMLGLMQDWIGYADIGSLEPYKVNKTPYLSRARRYPSLIGSID